MGSTLLKEIEIYRQDDLYVLLESVAEKNVSPITYRWYPAACGRTYDSIMPRVCRMANEIYNGNLHWRGRWGKTYGFVAHAEGKLENAVSIEGRIPHLCHFNVLYFKPDDPLADMWRELTRLDAYRVEKFFDEYVLRLYSPTIRTLNGAFILREALQCHTRYQQENLPLDYDALKQDIRKCYSLPKEMKVIFSKPCG